MAMDGSRLFCLGLVGSGFASRVLAIPGLVKSVEFFAPYQWLQTSFLAFEVLLLIVLGKRQPVITRFAS
jgi:hypothetical protein